MFKRHDLLWTAFLAAILASPSLAADAPPTSDQAPTDLERRLLALQQAVKDAKAARGRTCAPYEHRTSCRLSRPATDGVAPDPKR